MQKLVDGIHQFHDNIYCARKQFFEQMIKGQSPLALFITCADSRIDPAMLTQTEPGELFIMRNAGNIVPPYGAVQGGEAATLEYAVSVLRVRDIIVCGHSHCGAMGGLLNWDQLEGLPAVKSWLYHAEATARIIKENYQHVEDPQDRLTAAIKENVLVQVENLRTHPCVAAALGRGEINLHGWVYKLESGDVYSYDPEQGQFVSMDEAQERLTIGASTPAI